MTVNVYNSLGFFYSDSLALNVGKCLTIGSGGILTNIQIVKKMIDEQIFSHPTLKIRKFQKF